MTTPLDRLNAWLAATEPGAVQYEAHLAKRDAGSSAADRTYWHTASARLRGGASAIRARFPAPRAETK